MKIERINDNQIRCTLSSGDLSARNLNLGELAYGTEKARSLFREMIQKASTEVGFEAEDIPLMVEAIPLSGESVMLVITKIDDPEELDTRFSRFSPGTEEDQESSVGGLATELLEGADSLLELLRKDMMGMPVPDPSAPTSNTTLTDDTKKEPPLQTRIYHFSSLDEVIAAAQVAGAICTGHNTLYKNPSSSQYYLTLSNQGMEPLAFSRLCNVLAEYGEKVRQENQETAREAYYQEHYETIIKDQALQKLMLL